MKNMETKFAIAFWIINLIIIVVQSIALFFFEMNYVLLFSSIVLVALQIIWLYKFIK